MRRIAAKGTLATERLAGIEASITSLDDEDILDLADIFKTMPDSAMAEFVAAEMTRRNISL